MGQPLHLAHDGRKIGPKHHCKIQHRGLALGSEQETGEKFALQARAKDRRLGR
ncbi:hypothetical protein GCM10010402_45420 [Actinomadura luteofluorescens]